MQFWRCCRKVCIAEHFQFDHGNNLIQPLSFVEKDNETLEC